MGAGIRRHRLVIGVVAVVALAGVGVAAFALTGGFDDTVTTRASGRGPQIVRVALVDRAVGFDVSPDVVEVEPGTHVVLEVVNEAGGVHDLAIDGGPRTDHLEPGETQRIDLGRIDRDSDGRCTIGDHDIAGMTLDVRVV